VTKNIIIVVVFKLLTTNDQHTIHTKFKKLSTYSHIENNRMPHT